MLRVSALPTAAKIRNGHKLFLRYFPTRLLPKQMISPVYPCYYLTKNYSGVDSNSTKQQMCATTLFQIPEPSNTVLEGRHSYIPTKEVNQCRFLYGKGQITCFQTPHPLLNEGKRSLATSNLTHPSTGHCFEAVYCLETMAHTHINRL